MPPQEEVKGVHVGRDPVKLLLISENMCPVLPVGLPLQLVPEDAPDLAIGHAQPGLCHSDMGLLIFLEEIPNSSNVEVVGDPGGANGRVWPEFENLSISLLKANNFGTFLG